MDRKELEFYIAQSIHGELSREEETRLGQILKESSEARAIYAEMKRTWDLLDVWEVPEPPANLSQIFATRLAEQSQKAPSVLQKINRPYKRRFQQRWSWNLVGLGLAATLALGVFHIFNHKIALPPSNVESPRIVSLQTPVPTSINSAPTAVTLNPVSSRPTPESGPVMASSTARATLEYNRLPDIGVQVERLPKKSSRSQEANFAVHNFSANIPEMNTQHYNTVLASYENPL